MLAYRSDFGGAFAGASHRGYYEAYLNQMHDVMQPPRQSHAI
jgi:hypothetical protein